MRSLILSSALLAATSLLAGCVAEADPASVDEASQAVVPIDEQGCFDGTLVTRTRGFWRNHPCVVQGAATGYPLVPVSLGTTLLLDKAQDVEAYFSQPAQGDKQKILGFQLLAAKLNRAAFGIGSVAFADYDVDGDLETVDELIAIGDALFDAGSDADRVKAGTVLDKLNNAGDNEPTWFDVNCNSVATCDN